MIHSTGTILIEIIAALITATMTLTVGLIAVLFPLFRRYALARPNARSLHKISTPQGGGAAVVTATLVVTASAALWIGGTSLAGEIRLLSLFAGTILICVVGMVDDIWTVSFKPRLALQIFAVVLVVAALPVDLRTVPQVPFWLERVLLVLGLTWFVNLVNFMDGMDWISVVETASITAGLIILWYLGALPDSGGLVATALFGAMLGFAPFNRPVARLFLGDVGSLPLGLMLAWLLVLLAGEGHFAAAVIMPLYYLADATITLFRRIARREVWWEAHRNHFYQRAAANGLTAYQVTFRVAVINIALVTLAVATVTFPSILIDVVALMLSAFLVGFLLFDFARPRSATMYG